MNLPCRPIMKFHVLLLTFTVAISQPAHADLVDYALAQFDRRSVKRFIAHLPTTP